MEETDGFQTVISRKKKVVKQNQCTDTSENDNSEQRVRSIFHNKPKQEYKTLETPCVSVVEIPRIPNSETSINMQQNRKRILCSNFIAHGECPYGNTCVYAHSLKEQNIDPIRKKIYRILDNSNLLNDIDFVHDSELYKIFVQLTRTCYACAKNTCMGGYNCKKGAIDVKHTICYDDLYNKSCRYGSSCDKIHLTKRGLVPKAIQEKMMSPINDDNKQLYMEQLLSIVPEKITIDNLNDNISDLEYASADGHDDASLSDYEQEDIVDNEYVMILQPM